MGHLRHRGDVHGRDGGVGLRGLGQRLLLPAVLRRLLRRLPDVPRLLPDLRLRRVVQPVDGRLRPRRGGLRPVRRRRRRRAATTRGPGTYSRGAAAYGPYGSRAAGQAYNPRTGAYGQTRQGSSVYGSWGSTQVQRGDQWASTNRVTNRATGTTTRTTRTDGGAAAVTRTRPGRDSAASRARAAATSTPAGTATSTSGKPAAAGRSTRAGTGATSRPTPHVELRPPVDQLNRDYGARTEGSQRTSDYGSYRSGSSGLQLVVPLERRVPRRRPRRRRPAAVNYLRSSEKLSRG